MAANAQKAFTVETLRSAAKQSLRLLVVPVRLRRAIKKYLREEDDPHIRKKVRQLSESFQEIKDTNLQLPETTAKSLADSMNSVETKRWKIQTVYGDSDGETAAYIASRMPAVFSVCYRVLIEIPRRIPDFRPTRVLDFGAGTGSGFWAVREVWPKSVERVNIVEPSQSMQRAGRNLIQGLRDLPLIHGYTSLLALSKVINKTNKEINEKSERKHDLFIASYVLGEIPSLKDRITVVRQLWDLTDGLLVLVEPGTPHGANIISQMRSHILWMEKRKLRKLENKMKKAGAEKAVLYLKSGAHIVAPCPHDGKCPLENTGKYCHFVQRLQRTSSPRSYKRTKGVPLRGFEDEKFSFVVFRRGQRPRLKLFCEMTHQGLVGDAFTYNTLIHGYCQAGKLNVAQKVFNRMVDCCVPPDIVTYNILLDCLCNNRKIEKALVMVEDLQKSEIDLDIITYKVKEAWCLFRSLTLKIVKPDAIAYITMISGLCRKGLRREAHKLCRRMKEDWFMPSEHRNNEALRDHYTSLSAAPPPPPLGFEDALDLFFEMVQSQPLPSVVDFTRLLTAVADMKRYDTVIYLSQKMELFGISHDLYSFTVFLHCICRCSQLSLALSLLGKMMKLGFEPSIVTLGSLLHGFCIRNRFDDASSLVTSMVKSGYELNAVIYNTLIDGLCKNSHVNNALEVFNLMDQEGIQGDLVTYNTLLTGLCNSGRWSEAARLLRDMMNKRMNPDVITFTALIDAIAKEGNLSEAQELYKEMIQTSIDPNAVTYNSLINGLCMHGHLYHAKKTFDLMASKGCFPNVVTYNTLINGFCKYRRVDYGMKLFQMMSREGLVGDAFTYNTLIQGYCKVGELRVALDIFSWMVSCRVTPDIITHCILLHGLCVNGEIENAVAKFDDMRRSGKYIGVVAYNIMIHGLCKADKVEKAWELFCGLPFQGVKPDARTYTTMILGLCKNGPRREADELFRKMKEDGIICQLNGHPYRRNA